MGSTLELFLKPGLPSLRHRGVPKEKTCGINRQGVTPQCRVHHFSLPYCIHLLSQVHRNIPYSGVRHKKSNGLAVHATDVKKQNIGDLQGSRAFFPSESLQHNQSHSLRALLPSAHCGKSPRTLGLDPLGCRPRKWQLSQDLGVISHTLFLPLHIKPHASLAVSANPGQPAVYNIRPGFETY